MKFWFVCGPAILAASDRAPKLRLFLAWGNGSTSVGIARRRSGHRRQSGMTKTLSRLAKHRRRVFRY